MTAYILRRILLMIPTLVGITAVVFFIMAAAPGDVAELLISREGEMTPGDRAARVAYIRKRYGLNQPPPVQYARWLNKVSPIGFLTTDQIAPDAERLTAAEAVIAASDTFASENDRRRATKLVGMLARYRTHDPVDTAEDVVRAFEESASDPLAPARLIWGVGHRPIDLDAVAAWRAYDALPPGEARSGPPPPNPLRGVNEDTRLRAVALLEVRELAATDPAAARSKLLDRIVVDVDGVNRMVFSRPVFKAPDLGESFIKNRPVKDLIAEALPITLALNLISIPIVWSIAIASGVLAARGRGGVFDTVSGVFMLALWSVPTIWAGVLLIGFLANTQYVQAFPTAGLHDLRSDSMPFLPRVSATGFERGWLLDTLWHLCLPILCLSYGGVAFLSKLSRGAMLENLRADFVRTARAKGVAAKDVLWRHVFRNSLLPLITVAAHIIPGLLAGSLIVEVIFSIAGMGKLMITSIEFKDQEVVMAVTLIGGILTLLAYLLADLLYAVADPRVSYE